MGPYLLGYASTPFLTRDEGTGLRRFEGIPLNLSILKHLQIA
jgi:hypothetical protein